MVDEASILRSRIPASHKGKRIQVDEGIHGDHQKISFVELQTSASATTDGAATHPQPQSLSSRRWEKQMNFIISEEGWEPAKTTRKRRETDIDSRAIKAPSKPTGFDFFRGVFR